MDKDIKHGWKNVARRCQSVSRSGGLALVSITVLVDRDGNPRAWLEPSVKKIEPRKSQQEILRIMTNSDVIGGDLG